MTLQSAAAIATELANRIRAQESWARSTLWGERMVEAHAYSALHDGAAAPHIQLPTRPANSTLRREIEYIAQDAALRRLWSQHRIVYDIDPDLWAELGQMPDDQIIADGVMAWLPHPDPFVSLPDKLILPMTEDQVMRLEGFFVSGRTAAYDGDGQSQCSTHSPATNGNLGILFGATVMDKATMTPSPANLPGMHGVFDTVWSRVTLDVGHGDRTVGELIKVIEPRFQDAKDSGVYIDTVPHMIRAAIGALVYVCATNAELGTPRTVKAERIARNLPKSYATAKPAKAVSVGYHIGAAMRAHRARQAAQDAAEKAAGTGRTMRPHVRRPHPHTFRYGPGKTKRRVKFLGLIEVNKHLAGDDLPTVHKLKG